jgi:nitrous oxidase accessory protein
VVAQTNSIAADQLAQAIALAAPGDTLDVQGGTYFGHLVIDKPLTIIGHDWPVIDGGGEGSVLQITAPGTTVRGFVIQNSGHSLDQENTGIVVEATNTVVEDNRFEQTLFGIYLRQAHNSVVRGNIIYSKPLDVPRRGDGIRVWYSNDVLIENNTVEMGRDVVLWYSERLTVQGNVVNNGRYGLHFMYCDDAHIVQNRLTNNSVGAFLMYSRRMIMEHNTVAGNRGPSGYGIGLKDMDDAILRDNLFLDNRVGAYLDGSPREVDSIGQFQRNVFAYNDIGVEMMPSVRHNEFVANSFVDNDEQVAIAGGGATADNNAWTVADQGNYWSDYVGFDANGDGFGDIAYKSERLFENLVAQEPNLRLFLYSPAINTLDFAAKAFPIVRPQPKLVDERPFMSPTLPSQAPALPRSAVSSWFGMALLFVLLALGIIQLSRLRQQPYRWPQLEQQA